MTDNPTQPSGSSGEPTSGLYAFAECEMVPLPNGAVLLMDRFGDGQLMVAPPVAQSMPMCKSFRTLEQHTDLLTSTIPELNGQHADVMGVLGMLRDAGLMISAEAACERLNAPVEAALDLPATRGFIITCDRPAAVERLLESVLRSGKLSRHEALFLVDDSRDPENTARNRRAVEQFNLTSARNITYFGADETRAFMQSLIDLLPGEEAAIRFLIDRERWAGDKTFGLARNLCLLLSVGRRAIIMDDDVICIAAQSPQQKPGLAFGTAEREVEFYAGPREAMEHNPPLEFDPLAGHAECLGLSLGQAVARLGAGPVTPAQLAGSKSAYLQLWHANSRLLITQNGTLGDPGTSSTEWLYELEGASARRLLDFPGGVQGALTSRSYWLGYAQPCFTKMAVMSQVTGLDNSQLLPPYFPAYRGEDYLFGAMTEYLHPDSAVLNYPWCVPHLPLEQRGADAEPQPRDGRGLLNLGKFITDHTVYRRGIAPQTRLQSLAAMVAELSQTDDHGLALLYRKELAELQGLALEQLHSLLQDGIMRPPQWKEWLEASAQQVQQASEAPAALGEIRNVDKSLDEHEIATRFRELAAGFSASLASWVAIREAARSLAIQTALPQASVG